jgi:hypothetical protein
MENTQLPVAPVVDGAGTCPSPASAARARHKGRETVDARQNAEQVNPGERNAGDDRPAKGQDHRHRIVHRGKQTTEDRRHRSPARPVRPAGDDPERADQHQTERGREPGQHGNARIVGQAQMHAFGFEPMRQGLRRILQPVEQLPRFAQNRRNLLEPDQKAFTQKVAPGVPFGQRRQKIGLLFQTAAILEPGMGLGNHRFERRIVPQHPAPVGKAGQQRQEQQHAIEQRLNRAIGFAPVRGVVRHMR